MTRYAVECEMAQHLEDVYRRRTGLVVGPEKGGTIADHAGDRQHVWCSCYLGS